MQMCRVKTVTSIRHWLKCWMASSCFITLLYTNNCQKYEPFFASGTYRCFPEGSVYRIPVQMVFVQFLNVVWLQTRSIGACVACLFDGEFESSSAANCYYHQMKTISKRSKHHNNLSPPQRFLSVNASERKIRERERAVKARL